MEKYFAAANSGDGFVSWFDSIFKSGELYRRYIIKGGSGSGKSTVMKTAARRAEQKGASVEYFMCSADPASLDGIIITAAEGRRLAIIDGTAPHVTDPAIAGVTDEIFDTGSFWCDELLMAERCSCEKLVAKKKRFYADAYGCLGAAKNLQMHLSGISRGLILWDKMNAAANRMLTSLMKEKGIKRGECVKRLRPLSAISTVGEVNFTSFDSSERVFLTVDLMGCAPFWYEALIAAADRLGLSRDVSPMPLTPEFCEAVRFPELSAAFVSATERCDVKPVNMARFADKEKLAAVDRRCVRAIRKASGEIMNSALEKLHETRRCHMELEGIYKRAMDFTRLGDAAERLYTRMGI